jgi:hypothetical protein
MRDVAPGTVWQPYQNPAGQVTTALTLENHAVPVWRGPADQPANRRYFCHGHSLRTFERFGYSPFSGDPVRTVLEDEYYAVTRGDERAGSASFRIVQVNDIIAWVGQPESINWAALGGTTPIESGTHAYTVLHTARVIIPVITFGGRVDENQTMLTTKNGPVTPPAVGSIASISAVYGNTWVTYRKKKSD